MRMRVSASTSFKKNTTDYCQKKLRVPSPFSAHISRLSRLIVIIYVLTHIIVFTGIGISLYQNWGLRLEDAKSRLLRSAEMGNMLVENNLIDAAKSLDGAKQEIENKLRTTGLTSKNAYGILSSSIHEFNIYNKSNYFVFKRTI